MAPATLAVVGSIGAATAFVAASIGLTQRDIKRVLAYSTVSQLGFMFMALGVGAFANGIFHLFTHAWFKGGLFLCAGSVMHALAGELNMFKMGGLRRAMPITWITYLIGALAISGCPLTAGFFSKDAILFSVLSAGGVLGWALWIVGLAAALMTTIYMFRSVFLTFHGESRVEPELRHHLHESPRVMTVPLVILAAGSILAGYIGLPEWLGGPAIHHFLDPVMAPGRAILAAAHEGAAGAELGAHNLLYEVVSTVAAVAVFLIGLGVAYVVFLRGWPRAAETAAERLGPLYKISYYRWWWDDLYNAVVVRGTMLLAQLIGWFDNTVVDGFVNGTGATVAALGDGLRTLQNGRAQYYAIFILLGVVMILTVLFSDSLANLINEMFPQLHLIRIERAIS